MAGSDRLELRGGLQDEVTRIVWRLGEATVDEIRAEQAEAPRRAYATIQTVLNRLLDRGVLRRRRRGKAFVYALPTPSRRLLARAFWPALFRCVRPERPAVLLKLVEGLDDDELGQIAQFANRIRRERKGDERGRDRRRRSAR